MAHAFPKAHGGRQKTGLWESGRMYKIRGAKGHFICMVSFAGLLGRSRCKPQLHGAGLKPGHVEARDWAGTSHPFTNKFPSDPPIFFFLFATSYLLAKVLSAVPTQQLYWLGRADGHGSVAPKTCGPPRNGQDSLEHRACGMRGAGAGSWGTLRPRCQSADTATAP